MRILSKKKSYDIVIYGCLLVALVLIGIGGYSYIDGTSYSLKDIIYPEKQKESPVEPKELNEVDKKVLVENYITELLDEIKTDEVLTYETLRSWEKYEILNVEYEREIADNYHSYLVDLKITNQNAILPTKKNEKLSTDEYNVITIRFNVLKDTNSTEYSIKTTEIPKNS